MRRVGELACVVVWGVVLALACAGWLAPDGCDTRTALLAPSNCHP